MCLTTRSSVQTPHWWPESIETEDGCCQKKCQWRRASFFARLWGMNSDENQKITKTKRNGSRGDLASPAHMMFGAFQMKARRGLRHIRNVRCYFRLMVFIFVLNLAGRFRCSTERPISFENSWHWLKQSIGNVREWTAKECVNTHFRTHY